jgi:hypothetical protein
MRLCAIRQRLVAVCLVWLLAGAMAAAETIVSQLGHEGPAKGEERSMRGGAWADPSHNCLSCYRTCAEPTNPCEGFRLVIVP